MNTISHSLPAQRTLLPVRSEAPSQAATSVVLTAAENPKGSGIGQATALTRHASPTEPSEKTVRLSPSERSSKPQQGEIYREPGSEAESTMSASEGGIEHLSDFLSSLKETDSAPGPTPLNNDVASAIQYPKDADRTVIDVSSLTRTQPFNQTIQGSTDSVQNLLRHAERNSFAHEVLRTKAKKNPQLQQHLSELKHLREGTVAATTGKAAFDALSRLTSTKFKANKGVDLTDLLPPNSKFKNMIDPFTGAVRDPATGLYADLRFDTSAQGYLLCFPGTGVANMGGKHWDADLKQFLGTNGVPPLYAQAAELADTLNQVLASRDAPALQLTGHSMGGGIANYAGLVLGLKSTCFNAAALGGACVADLSAKGRLTPENINLQTHIRLKGDAVSSPKTQKSLTAALKRIGVTIKQPALVGTVYVGTVNKPEIKRLNAIERHQMVGIGHLYH